MMAIALHPRPRSTLMLMAALGCFVSLGLWQLDRAGSREAVQRLADARALDAPVPITASVVGADDLNGRRVAAVGRYEAGRLFFLDNRVWRDQAGYHVITPLRIAGGDTCILVDRGWIPAPAERNQVPVISTPDGPVKVDGVAYLPPAWTFTLGKASDQWQPVWPSLDLARFQSITGLRLQPVVLRMASDSPAGGFVRDWPRADAGAERNRAYALQWFGFAATAVGLWLWFAVERRKA